MAKAPTQRSSRASRVRSATTSRVPTLTPDDSDYDPLDGEPDSPPLLESPQRTRKRMAVGPATTTPGQGSSHRGKNLVRNSQLPRNKACLACRRRRTKCDAAKPQCGACVRHRNFLRRQKGHVDEEECACVYEEVEDGSESRRDSGASSAQPEVEDTELPMMVAMGQRDSSSRGDSRSSTCQDVITPTDYSELDTRAGMVLDADEEVPGLLAEWGVGQSEFYESVFDSSLLPLQPQMSPGPSLFDIGPPNPSEPLLPFSYKPMPSQLPHTQALQNNVAPATYPSPDFLDTSFPFELGDLLPPVPSQARVPNAMFPSSDYAAGWRASWTPEMAMPFGLPESGQSYQYPLLEQLLSAQRPLAARSSTNLPIPQSTPSQQDSLSLWLRSQPDLPDLTSATTGFFPPLGNLDDTGDLGNQQDLAYLGLDPTSSIAGGVAGKLEGSSEWGMWPVPGAEPLADWGLTSIERRQI